ncbi:hypothetical protein B0H19DRAFT_1086120, partial [Mycena capillaripes]
WMREQLIRRKRRRRRRRESGRLLLYVEELLRRRVEGERGCERGTWCASECEGSGKKELLGEEGAETREGGRMAQANGRGLAVKFDESPIQIWEFDCGRNGEGDGGKGRHSQLCASPSRYSKPYLIILRIIGIHKDPCSFAPFPIFWPPSPPPNPNQHGGTTKLIPGVKESPTALLDPRSSGQVDSAGTTTGAEFGSAEATAIKITGFRL